MRYITAPSSHLTEKLNEEIDDYEDRGTYGDDAEHKDKGIGKEHGK